jgi:LuxR family maltose regulon positive regulatory protein
MSIQSAAPFVIRTKLHRPRIAENRVSLIRAQQRLAYVPDRPFTLVCAPAGFGKTTLLCEWLANNDRQSAWLSLDERDSDPAIFLTYLIAAIRTVFPDACAETKAMLDVPNLPPVPVISATLSNEIDHLAETDGLVAGQRFILVLDDYHRINHQDVHQIVNDLLLHPPRPLHLVISARHDPPLSLHTLRVRGEVVEIRSNALRFTIGEIAAFAQKAIRVPIDDATIQQVAEFTEGWAAGLRFAALALNASDGNAPLVTASALEHRFVIDYLSNEVLIHLPAATQTFLIQTAILEQLNSALCDAVLTESEGVVSCQQRLEWLERENVFTSAQDDQGRWYRYHSLFRRLLLDQLERRYGVEQITLLHRRASAWYAAHAFVEDALHHALMAGDATNAAQIIEAYRHKALNYSQFQRLDQWLKLLPVQLIEERPGLLIIEAWLLAERWRTPDMNALLDRIEALLPDATLSASERVILESEIAALRSDYCYFIGDRAELLRFSRHALDLAPMTLSYVRRFAWLYYLAALQLHGDFNALQDALHTSLREDRIHGDAFPISPLITHCAASWMNADLATLHQSALHLLRLTQERDLFNEQGWAYLYLGCVAYQRDELESARQAFTTIVNRPYSTHGHAFWQGAFGLAAVYCAQGACSQAQALSDSLLATALEMGGANVLAEAQTLRAFVALQQGNIVEAQRWAASYDRGQRLAPMSMFYAAPLVLARILLDPAAPKNYADAEAWINQIYDFSLETYNLRVQIEMLALRAILNEMNGERANALKLLEKSVTLAAPGNLVRMFTDLGATIAPLLIELRDRGCTPEFVDRVVKSLPPMPESTESSTPHRLPTSTADAGKINHDVFIERLTHRESEVLELLARHLTSSEIAKELVISENTVKRHRANIYQKLGVNRRRDAIAVAQKALLLPKQ